jgi:hypothetical protein
MNNKKQLHNLLIRLIHRDLQTVIKESEGPTYGNTNTNCDLSATVTGIWLVNFIIEKVGQLETLLNEGWISIDR